MKGYYLDMQGKLCSITIAVKTQYPNGQIVDFSGHIIFKKGAIVSAVIVPDLENYKSRYYYFDPNKFAYDYLIQITTDYQKANKVQFDKFINDGNPEIQFIFPLQLIRSTQMIDYLIEK